METSTYLLLQEYWYLIVSVLGGLLVFLLFVQGGQTYLLTLAKHNDEQTLLVNTLGRKWEFTFTTLVTFGGAFFASFPIFYATSFGGAYWVWTIILFAFVIQAVSFEFRSRENNFLGKKTYDTFLFLNGTLGTILIGTAVATFFTGSAFVLGDRNEVLWQTSTRGLEAAFNLHNLSLGIAIFFLARLNGLNYFQNTIDDAILNSRIRKSIKVNIIGFLVSFLTFLIWLMLRDGYAVDAEGVVSMEPYKYFNNLVAMPIVAVVMLAGIVLVLFGIWKSLFEESEKKAIWFTGFGTFLTATTLLLIAGYNNTAFYPSSFDLQSSLTIRNASSSLYTLKAMSFVSILIPFVVAYIWFAWRAMNKKPITREELNSHENHVY